MTSLPSDRPTTRPSVLTVLHVSQLEVRHPSLGLIFRREIAWPTALPPRFFGTKLHRQLRLRKKNFEDDVYDKTQTQFMNKSTNMKSKEKEIERDRENRRRRSEARRQRERLRAVANRRNMSDEQREKEQERVPKKPRVAAQGFSVSFHIGLHR